MSRTFLAVLWLSACGYPPLPHTPGACAADGDCAHGQCCAGRCIDPDTDGAHCGGCGNACGSAGAVSSACTHGVCAVQCGYGFGDCNADPKDGCEAPLLSSVQHCNACNHPCTVPNATPACDDGTCRVGVCDALYADCNGFPDDGCEVHLNQPSSCGACGVVCAPAHAVPACAGGVCAITVCEAGWADCDHDAGNGCEASLWTDGQCGACGAACAAGATCIEGTCAAPELLFFGGAMNHATLPATETVSAYDLTHDAWRALATAGAEGPGARVGHAAVWDAAGQRMLVWGGYGESGATTDTDVWALELGAPGKPVWRRLAASGPPSLRGWFGAAWDPAARVLFVYGGWSQSQQEALDGLWQLNVATLTWTLRPEAGPGPRARPSLKWDAPNQRLVLAGGVDALSVPRTDVSAFVPSTGAWSGLPSVPGQGRQGSFFLGDGVVLFGGLGGGQSDPQTFLNTLQELQPTGWVTWPANTGPRRGWMSGVGFGPRLFVYGGFEYTASQVKYFDALFEFSNGGWRARPSTGTPHPGVIEASVVVRGN